jgi:GTP-binding protein
LESDAEAEPAWVGAVVASITFLGRPNVGKSSLINAILREPRVAVSEIPGTTRDVVDTFVTTENGQFCLLDTAGVRHRGKVTDEIESVSALRSLRSIGRCDVAVLVVDATDQITTQDERISSAVVEKGCGLLIAVNKWDLVQDSDQARQKFREELYVNAPFLRFAGVRFVSALSGMGVDSILRDAKRIRERRSKVFSSDELRSVFDELSMVSPGGSVGYRLRLHSLSQAGERIPTFFVWCNDPRFTPKEYERFWENELTTRLRLEGIPIRVIFRRRPKKNARSGRVQQRG